MIVENHLFVAGLAVDQLVTIDIGEWRQAKRPKSSRPRTGCSRARDMLVMSGVWRQVKCFKPSRPCTRRSGTKAVLVAAAGGRHCLFQLVAGAVL